MRIWIAIFSAALFAGGTCLGVALQPKLKPVPVVPVAKPAVEAPTPTYLNKFSVHRFETQLGLSPEQQEELNQILNETQIILEEKGRDIRAAHDRSRSRIMELLSDDQKKKLDDLLAAERQKRAEDEAERTVKTYTKLLDLSPEQAVAFRNAVVEAKNKKQGYYGRTKHGGDHEQSRAFFRSVREEQNKSIEKSLTPEQFKRYLEMSELER